MADQGKKLSVAQMREILKAKGVKNTSVMRKAELQEQMAALGLLENKEEKSEEVQEEQDNVTSQPENTSAENHMFFEAGHREQNARSAITGRNETNVRITLREVNMRNVQKKVSVRSIMSADVRRAPG